MGVFYKRIDLRENKRVADHTIRDFKGDFELNKKIMHDTSTNGDETGIMYYTYKEMKGGNRVEFKGTDLSGDGFVVIMTKYEYAEE